MDTEHKPAHEGDLPGVDVAKDLGDEEVAEDDGSTQPFSWVDDAADIAVAEQLAIAVFLGAKGDIIIIQQADIYEERDPIISVRPTDAAALAQAILDRAGIE